MCPLGIFLNFLFYFNSLVSKIQFKISMEVTLLLGITCTFDECRKVVCTAMLHSFLSAFLGIKRSACEKLNSPPLPKYFYMPLPEFLRVTLQLDMKSLCFSKVVCKVTYILGELAHWKNIGRDLFFTDNGWTHPNLRCTSSWNLSRDILVWLSQPACPGLGSVVILFLQVLHRSFTHNVVA